MHRWSVRNLKELTFLIVIMNKEENEVKELYFFRFNELPSNISSPDLPITQEYLQKHFL